MELKEYKEFLLTQNEFYSKKVAENLVGTMRERNIISFENSELEKANNCKELIRHAINNIGVNAVNVLEEWEFIKNYQYSVLYKTQDIDYDSILASVEELGLAVFNLDKTIHEEMQFVIRDPIVYLTNDKILLKFPLMKTGVKPSGQVLKVKYPVVVVLHIEENVAEVRYDSINGVLVDDYKQFYKKNLTSIRAWLRTKLKISVDTLDLYDAVVKVKDSGYVKLGGQDMRFANGGKACLEVGHDVSYTLPLIGELKEIMRENEDEFNRAITIKQVLDTWIKSKEEEADYIWICLCWPDNKNRKTYEVRARFVFDYFGEDETLICHYSGVIGMERMDNVTTTIVKNL